jgi:hypothetical protein
MAMRVVEPCTEKTVTKNALRRARRKQVCPALPPLGAAYRYNQPVGRTLRARSLNWREALPRAHFLVDPQLEEPDRLTGLLERISRAEVGVTLPSPRFNVPALLRGNAAFCSQLAVFAQRFRRLRLRPMLNEMCPMPGGQRSLSDKSGYALATRQVVCFLRTVLRKSGLLAALGGPEEEANRRWAEKCVRFYVSRPKMARCPLGQLMAGLQCGTSSWGQLGPKVVANHLLAKFLGEDLLLLLLPLPLG